MEILAYSSNKEKEKLIFKLYTEPLKKVIGIWKKVKT
jgi:hypothetical protein